MVYAFGEFELDEGLYQLRRAGQRIKLEPRVFDVLRYLLRHRDRVVSKDELLDAVWSGDAVSESVLPTNVAAVRRALRGDPVGRAAIQTVHGRGYRFVAPVELREAAATPGRAAAPARAGGTPFVGRDAAMGRLRAGLDEAAAGRGGLMLVVGEPGIGKTRTLEELAHEARARGARVFTGRCHEGEGAPAFWPWVQILRQSLRDRDAAAALGSDRVEVAELLPELREGAPGPDAPAGRSPESARFRLFETVARFLERESRDAPVLLLLDDLHWADKPSLLLLQFLARELSEARIVLVGSYRDVEVGRRHPLAATLGDLARAPRCERVRLRGLEREDVERFVREAGHDPPPPVVDLVHEMTDGNPFFLGEIVQLWAGEGLSGRLASGAGRIALPQGIRDAVGRRLDALSDDCGRVLGVASVLGREFHLRVLERVADLPAEGLLACLDEAAAARLAEPLPAGVGTYRFGHLLIRETLYDELSTPERVRLHRRAAEALEEIYGSDHPAHVSELAHHLYEAAPGGDAEKAVSVSLRAAEQAMRVLAYEESAAHYRRALDTLDLSPRVDETRRCEMLLALSDAHDRAAEFERSRDAAQRALAAARGLGRRDLLARAALAISGRFDFGPLSDAGSAHLEEALEALGDEEPVLRCRLLARLAVSYPHRDSLEARRELSQRAVDLARSTGDANALLDALGALGYPGLLGPDTDEERLEVAAEVEELARRTGRRDKLLRVHEDRMRSYLALGDMPAADREVEAHRRLATALRDSTNFYFTHFYRVARLIGQGRFAEAEGAIHECLEGGRRIAGYDEARAVTAHGIFYLHVFHLLRQKGELSRLTAGLPEYRSLATFAGPILECVDAYICHFTGERDRSLAIYRQIAESGFEGIPVDEWFLMEISLLAELAHFHADAKGADRLYALLLPYAGRNVVGQLFRTYDGSAQRFLGLCAWTAGRLEDADRHFGRAAEHNARMEAWPALAWTLCDHAGALRERGRRGDAGRAGELLERCLERAEALGMPALAERVRAGRS